MMRHRVGRIHHRNTTDQTQWIQEKWDLTLQMMWYNGMHNYPIWLIEVEQDLFLISYTQLYQSTRMMMPLYYCSSHHRNTTDRTQWIQEKWDLTLQMMWYNGMHYHPVSPIEVEIDLFSMYKFNTTNQGEGFCSIETTLTELNGYKRSEIWQFKWFCILECIITQFHRLKLRKIYSSLHLLNYTNQREWWCPSVIPITTETPLTKLNGYKRSEIWHCKWFGIQECIITQTNRLKLRKIYLSLHSLNYTNQREWWCPIETILTNLNGFKCFRFCNS